MFNEDQPSVLPAVPRILCIGDVHGDLGRLTELLKALRVIDSNTRWIAEPSNTIVVQLGDQLDSMSRGTLNKWETVADTEVVRFMDNLDNMARIHGGRALSLLGNHEIMNVLGDFNFVSQNSMEVSGGLERRQHTFRVGGPMAQLLSKRCVVLKVGSVTFCHGGILPEHLDMVMDNPAVINTATRKFLRGKQKWDEHYDAFLLQNTVIGYEGILWTRKYFELLASGNTEQLDAIMKEVCSRLNSSCVVVGHNTVPTITGAANGALWLVDAALSRAYDSRVNEVLEILHDDDPAQPTMFRIVRLQKDD